MPAPFWIHYITNRILDRNSTNVHIRHRTASDGPQRESGRTVTVPQHHKNYCDNHGQEQFGGDLRSWRF